ncbi:hypothetical protein PAMP_020392 [Pampus punctatissimus]
MGGGKKRGGKVRTLQACAVLGAHGGVFSTQKFTVQFHVVPFHDSRFGLLFTLGSFHSSFVLFNYNRWMFKGGDPSFQSVLEMQKTNKKRRALRTSLNIIKAAPQPSGIGKSCYWLLSQRRVILTPLPQIIDSFTMSSRSGLSYSGILGCLAVHTDSNLQLAPALRSEPNATFSIANNTRGVAAVIALRLAQIEAQAQIALQQLATLAIITVNNQRTGNNGLTTVLPPHLALLSLLNRQQVSAVGFNVDTNIKTYRTAQLYLSAAMYHHSQQQGKQPFSNGPRPPHHQPPPNQHQNRPSSDMLSQTMGFQFPRPTQLPDELESALAIRGARDMDHRLIDQHQNQSSGSGMSQHGSYGSNPVTLNSDNQAGHQQGVDWSNYQPPTKLFASAPPSTNNQSQRHQGPQQQPQSSHAGTTNPGWAAPSSDLPSSQARHPHGVGGDGQGLYTPESAGSILASFGLSNEDLEVLSHYPDDQLTPDTLPFILRDIQINKSGNQKTVASTSSSSFSHNINDILLPSSRSSPLARSHSPEVPSLLTVTQTAGKVIDYGHASRSEEESSTRETVKREQLSSERTVKMYPSSSSPKADRAERRQVRLEHTESSKHGDRDYRRMSRDNQKSNPPPGREFPPSSKSRNLDRDYRRDGPKPRPSSETRSEASSRRSLSSSSGIKPHSSGKKLPTPTMISDFSAVSPKVYPHTCSLCHIQCDQEKDWFDHINTVNHTAACRDLRNKYPDWKPNLSSLSDRYGGRPKDHPLSCSMSPSLSRSPSPSPPHSKHRVGLHAHRPQGRPPYSPHHHPRHHYTDRGHRLEHQQSGLYSPSRSHGTSSSFRDLRPEKRDRESSGGSSRSGVKRPHDELTTSRHPPSSKAGYSFKHGPSQSSNKIFKSGIKLGTKMTKPGSAKAADTSAKPPPTKKKKKIMTPASQGLSVADRLLYLTGIPKDASEQEVTDLVGSFGKINNVILMPCSEEESQKGKGQKASVCMVKAEGAQALANTTSLSIRDEQITVSVAKKPEAEQSSDTNSKPTLGQDKCTAGEDSGGEAEQKTSDEKSMVLITGLPESGWSESDIIKLFQPFGTPFDIILAAPVGKALVSVADMETAEEIVKVHAFSPAKIQDSELKMIHFKQRIGINTPESPAAVGWSKLLVISNVPDTPSGSSEVQNLVRRFGTVIKTLVLNNMVICEMATAAMALSVHKRFQKFPCIIQNNPLFFSRKRDPTANTQAKVLTTYPDSPEDIPANGNDSQIVLAGEEVEKAHKENSESLLEGKEKDRDEKDEMTRSTEKMVSEEEALQENGSRDVKIIKDEPTNIVSNSSAAQEADLETNMSETSAVETVLQAAEDASEAGNQKTPAGEKTPTEATIPKFPKVTQEMVNALLVECRTRTASHPDKMEAPTGEEQGETKTETAGGKKAADDIHESTKNHTEEEVKKQERERKEREARKEKEARERRERRAWEKEEKAKREREREERARREREKREEERREWERKERERRDRKRVYVDASLGSRSSCRSQTYKQNYWKEEDYSNSEAERSRMVQEEEEEFDDFPFNMSDFVTVDEVGDVADLPHSASPDIPVETTDAPTSAQQDTPQDLPMEVTEEAATPVKSDKHISACEPVPASLVSSDMTGSPVITPAASQAASPCSQTHPDTESTPAVATDSTPVVEPPPTPADSNSPATGVVTAESEADEEEQSAPHHNQAKKEVKDKTEEQKTMQGEEDKETSKELFLCIFGCLLAVHLEGVWRVGRLATRRDAVMKMLSDEDTE